MSTTPTTGFTGINGTQGTTLSPSANSGQLDPILGKDSFLKLMMVQLEHQDPLNPQDPSQYLGQLAQMTTLEQETNIATSSAASAESAATTQAVALLGHNVTYIDANGNPQTGQVQKIDLTSSGPALTIGGVAGIPPSWVNQIS